MNRYHPFGVEFFHCLNILSGQKMNITPVSVILTILQNSKVETAVFSANLFIMVVVTAVTADVYSLCRSLYNETCPQGLVPLQATTGKMSCRLTVNAESISQLSIFKPIQFGNDLRIESPIFKMFRSSKACGHSPCFVLKFPDRLIVEMVPMVVSDDKQVQLRYVVCCIKVASFKGFCRECKR